MYNEHFMQRALALSARALQEPGTEPFGAVVVKNGEVGSWCATEWLKPSPTTSPFLTTTAPKGSVPGSWSARAERARARCMKCSWYMGRISWVLRRCD